MRDMAPHYSAAAIDEYTKTLRNAAHRLAQAIPSLETVYLWRPRETGRIEWAPFEVVRRARRSDTVEIRCPVNPWKRYGRHDGPRYPAVPIPGQYDVDEP